MSILPVDPRLSAILASIDEHALEEVLVIAALSVQDPRTACRQGQRRGLRRN